MKEGTLSGKRIRPRYGKSKLGLTVSEISRELRSIIDARFKEHGVSSARWVVLWALEELGEPVSQKRIANLLGIESPTLVRMLDRLEEDGLVRRNPSVEDRRVKLVELCAKAEPLLEEMHALFLQLEKDLYVGFSEEELIQAHNVMLKLRDRVFDLSGKTREDVIDHISHQGNRG
ncbi:MarR family transcriptional regulator [Desulfovibrio mangrovi]|uniref:MarR family winged helix-turn-helix transcriptional regulator n=1 Tax=Desulfovibrio mangrovi TaxID=2976983 RepID=UPI0022484AC1|nr:MarR family transcriptional regulator [Desulfovibrio mangrovi]UZP68941.1 MarR family transcriptional regulator [Desulfovibrio mangrovi]